MVLPDPFILGLHGRAGVGKDTAADYLAQHYGFVRFAFADPIREMLFTLLESCGISRAWITEPHLKEQPIPGLGHSYRELAQSLGTDWARQQLGQDFWLRTAEMALGISVARIDIHQAIHDRIVISDVRFQNEANWVSALAGMVIGIQRASAPAVRNHISEHINVRCASLIHNNSAIPQLHRQLDALMDQVGIGKRERPVATAHATPQPQDAATSCAAGAH